jgi:Ca2+-binding RTX toxin-like protein
MLTTRRTLALLATSAAFAACATPASAAVSCSYSAGMKKLSISATADDDQSAVRRGDGGALVVQNASCSGATVTNTDTIAFVDLSNGGSAKFRIDLRGGRLGPGATPELGEGNIEVTAALSDGLSDVLEVVGGDDGVDVSGGTKGAGFGLDLDAGSDWLDVDVMVTGAEDLWFAGGAGNDRFTAAGGGLFDDRIPVGVTAEGYGGNDDLRGGDDDDLLYGSEGDDVLRGGPGDDLMTPGTGDDDADGGAGDADGLNYNGSPAGVDVDLGKAAEQDTGGSGNETIAGVENVYGTPHADALRGNEADNELAGFGGDDLLVGRAGNDKLTGHDGSDTVAYANPKEDPTQGVLVDLAGGYAKGADGDDTLGGVENAIGSPKTDVLMGTDGPNRLEGRAGTDSLAGGAGDDQLLARDGEKDNVLCAEGADTAVTDLAGVDTLTACETIDAEKPVVVEPTEENDEPPVKDEPPVEDEPTDPVKEDQGPVKDDQVVPVEQDEAKHDEAPVAPVAPAENAPAAPAPAPAPPASAPAPPAATAATTRALRLTLGAAKRLRRGKLRATVACDAACTVQLSAVVTIGKRKVVVKATRKLAAGKRSTVALRMPKGARSVKLTAVAGGPGLTPASAAKALKVVG